MVRALLIFGPKLSLEYAVRLQVLLVRNDGRERSKVNNARQRLYGRDSRSKLHVPEKCPSKGHRLVPQRAAQEPHQQLNSHDKGLGNLENPQSSSQQGSFLVFFKPCNTSRAQIVKISLWSCQPPKPGSDVFLIGPVHHLLAFQPINRYQSNNITPTKLHSITPSKL